MKMISNTISWIENQWLENEVLKLPIIDRGQTLSDGIFETILIYKKKAQLLDAHLERWKHSAKILGMQAPPNKQTLLPLIEEAISRLSLKSEHGALRLNWSRGNNTNRGIQISKAEEQLSSHRFWLELNQHDPCFNPISTMISKHETRNPKSQLSQCKTFAYLQSIHARNESIIAGYNDALLLSTNGEMSCGTTSNILIKRNNTWITPRKESGCLPGIMRQQGIKMGIFKEAKISPKPEPNDQWLLINSLNCHPISSINTDDLDADCKAKEIWHILLNEIH